MNFFYAIHNCLELKIKKVYINSGLKINGKIFIHGKKKGILIGKNVTINSSENSNPTSGFNHTHLSVGPKGKLIIGNNVGISQACISSYEEVIIEDNVFIGSGVKIWDTDFHPISFRERVNNFSCKTKSIHICNGAFIGACSIILKGVTIGERSVIGAGSVVTKDIPNDEIWGGNPARFIKRINNKEFKE